MVSLGLYRLAGASDNNYSYVYSNPSLNRKTKLIVTQRDRVFVLGKDIPKELIIDYSIKSNNKPDTNGISEEQNEKRFGKEGATSVKNKDFYGNKQNMDE